MTTTLITGANKGLGKETARQLVAAGHDVYVGARDRARGRAEASEVGARFVHLDVTDSAGPVIVNLSSGLASLTDLSDPSSYTHFYPGLSYPASKTAINAITIQYAKAFPGIRINAVDPGYTNTDLNDGAGTQTVDEGAAIIVRMAQIGPDGPTGTFVSAHGRAAW